MKPFLDKLGSFGAIVAAAACPICFPKLALLGAVVGLGGLGAYEAQLFIVAQALVVLAVLGHVLSFRQRGKQWQLATAILSAAAFFFALYLFPSEWLAYAALAGLLVASAADLWSRRADAQAAVKTSAHPPQA